MGSLKEFKEAVRFSYDHKIVPIVDRIINGLECAEEAFKIMDESSQFGKLVLMIGLTSSKL